MNSGGRLVGVGEAMLELTDHGGGTWRLGVAGDSFNTIVHAARLGVDTAYLTAIGCDPLSARVADALRAEGVSDELVLAHPSRLVGLYLVETPAGEDRRFHYWRDTSAARELLACPGAGQALERAARARLLYLSGITLAIVGGAGRARLVELAGAVRRRGGRVAFDPNWRPRLWPGPPEARAAIAAFAPVVDIALPTFDDEAALFGHATPGAALAWWAAHGVGEVALKLGPEGALLSDGRLVPVPARRDPVDATGAGDAFNAAYLAARLAGRTREAAAEAGHALAGATVGHRGALARRASPTPARR